MVEEIRRKKKYSETLWTRGMEKTKMQAIYHHHIWKDCKAPTERQRKKMQIYLLSFFFFFKAKCFITLTQEEGCVFLWEV